MRRITLLLAAWVALLAQPAGAQNWVDSLFPERAFDLGTVARGSKVHHTFKLVNRSGQEVHIASWRTKCGCTEVHVGAREIPPGLQTGIEAVIDTTKFQGPKSSGLTLVIDRPYYTEVDLNLTCFIRGDITLTPGQVDFGTVQRSAGPELSLNLVYAGGVPNWGITKMQTRSPHLSARIQEQGRTYEGQLSYLLTATLKPGIGNGPFKDEITLFTNDPSSPAIPISVTANVQTAVTVTPSPILLGRVKAGETIKRTVIVRSPQPFKLLALKPSKDELSATTDPDGAGPIHKVDLTFKAPAVPGPYNGVVEIETDVKDEPPTRLPAFATVVP
jgi:hypothetical protein